MDLALMFRSIDERLNRSVLDVPDSGDDDVVGVRGVKLDELEADTSGRTGDCACEKEKDKEKL